MRYVVCPRRLHPCHVYNVYTVRSGLCVVGGRVLRGPLTVEQTAEKFEAKTFIILTVQMMFRVLVLSPRYLLLLVNR